MDYNDKLENCIDYILTHECEFSILGYGIREYFKKRENKLNFIHRVSSSFTIPNITFERQLLSNKLSKLQLNDLYCQKAININFVSNQFEYDNYNSFNNLTINKSESLIIVDRVFLILTNKPKKYLKDSTTDYSERYK